MSLHKKYFEKFTKMATITNIWPYATYAMYKKVNTISFAVSTAFAVKNMHFNSYSRGFHLLVHSIFVRIYLLGFILVVSKK